MTGSMDSWNITWKKKIANSKATGYGLYFKYDVLNLLLKKDYRSKNTVITIPKFRIKTENKVR